MTPMLSVIVLSTLGLLALALLPFAWRAKLPLLRRSGARWAVFGWALACGVVLDLASKAYAFEHLPGPRDTIAITSWFSFSHAKNLGAAFGMFERKHAFFMVVTVAALVAVPYFVQVARQRVLGTAAVMGLVLSGVIGNFWDRVVHGHVRDFLDVHTPPSGALYDFFKGTFGTHVWPTFNVADIFITCGAVVVVLLLSKEDAAPAAAPATPGDPAPPAVEAAPPEAEAAPSEPVEAAGVAPAVSEERA